MTDMKVVTACMTSNKRYYEIKQEDMSSFPFTVEADAKFPTNVWINHSRIQSDTGHTSRYESSPEHVLSR